MSRPLIINFAPTGMVPTRAMIFLVPLSVDEIVENVHEAAELGITIAHVHVREPDGRPSCRPELFAEVCRRIRRLAPELGHLCFIERTAFHQFWGAQRPADAAR